jgi:hypothetical protein
MLKIEAINTLSPAQMDHLAYWLAFSIDGVGGVLAIVFCHFGFSDRRKK